MSGVEILPLSEWKLCMKEASRKDTTDNLEGSIKVATRAHVIS